MQAELIGAYPILVDLGSGFGYCADKLRQHAEYVVGLDIFSPSLQVARERKVFDDLICADILHLPLSLGKIDCVTLFDVIEHLSKNDGKGLLESLETSVFLSTPNSNRSNRCYARLVGNPLEHHLSTWSTSDLEDLGYRASARNPPMWMFLLGNRGIVLAHKLRRTTPAGRSLSNDRCRCRGEIPFD